MISVVDRSTWRHSFAQPGEHLILVLAAVEESVDEVLEVIPKQKPTRILLFGGRSSRWDVRRLDSFTAPLIEPLSDVADLVVLMPGRESIKLGKNAHSVRASQLLASASTSLVLYNEWGIGDELLLSAVARELKRAHPGIDLWVKSRYGFRFPGFVRQDPPSSKARRIEAVYQNPTMYGPENHAPFPGHLVQQMLDKVYVDTGIYVKAEDIHPVLDGARHQPGRRRVILHSRSNPRLPSKEWGVERWRSLCELLHAEQVEIVQVGAEEEPLLPYTEDRRGTPVSELHELVAEAGLVVCLVGFLMHLAAAVGTPAVVIYGGREHPAIDGYPEHTHLTSDPLPCKGRWGCHLAPDIKCSHEMRCMNSLTPKLVATEALALL